jgi:hypothetical protein
MVTRTKCYCILPEKGACQKPIVHWWLGYCEFAAELCAYWLVGFCREHGNTMPSSRDYQWRPVSEEEIAVYQVMDS